MDLNKVMLIGRLTQKPEKRVIASGQSVASFGLATNRKWTDKSGQKQEQAEFHNIVVWGKLADICDQYLDKGRRAFFEGRLQTRSWDGQDGVKRYKTEIVADNMIMLDGRGGNGGEAPAARQPVNEIVIEEAPLANMVESEIKVEDIPF